MASDFQIRLAQQQDLEGIVQVNAAAFDSISAWRHMVKDMDPSVLHEFLSTLTRKRYRQSHFRYFVAIHQPTSQVVGCAGLELPTTSSGNKPKPAFPPGMNQELAAHFFGRVMMQCNNYGYDPTKHCRRAGTFIHPDFQRRGLGDRLTRECNKAADALNASTYVTAIGSSLKMFVNGGYRELGMLETRLKDYGGPDETHVSYACYRDAHGGNE